MSEARVCQSAENTADSQARQSDENTDLFTQSEKKRTSEFLKSNAAASDEHAHQKVSWLFCRKALLWKRDFI